MNIVDAVVSSFAAALALLFTFVPRLIGFLVILLVGYLVATALSKAVTFLLRKIGFDRISTRIGLTRLESQMGVKMDAAGILGRIVYWFVFLIFLVPAVDSLGLTAVSALLGQVVAYIPNVFVAILILFLGTLASTFVADNCTRCRLKFKHWQSKCVCEYCTLCYSRLCRNCCPRAVEYWCRASQHSVHRYYGCSSFSLRPCLRSWWSRRSQTPRREQRVFIGTSRLSG